MTDILENIRKALKLVAELPPMPVRIRMYPTDWESMRSRFSHRPDLPYGSPYGVSVIIDPEVESGHPVVEFSDGSTKTLGSAA